MEIILNRSATLEGKILSSGAVLDLPESQAKKVIEAGYADPAKTIMDENAIRLPIIQKDGIPLAWSNDPPHIRVFAWSLTNLRFALWEPTDLERIARDCALSFSDARKGLARLVQDGDLKVERDRGKEYYWLTPLWYRKMT